MSLRIGDTAPDFTAQTTRGRIRFYDWIGNGWAILFSHPKDFTPVCTTELAHMARIASSFEARGCRIIGLSTDTLGDHERWMADIESLHGVPVSYPIISDTDLNVARLYNMLPANTTPGARTAADNATVRAVVVIGPDRTIKATIVYPMSTGRNFDEVLRLLDSLQLTAERNVATPVNWTPGDDVIIPPGVSNEEARLRHPQGWKTLTPYLRFVRLEPQV